MTVHDFTSRVAVMTAAKDTSFGVLYKNYFNAALLVGFGIYLLYQGIYWVMA